MKKNNGFVMMDALLCCLILSCICLWGYSLWKLQDNAFFDREQVLQQRFMRQKQFYISIQECKSCVEKAPSASK